MRHIWQAQRLLAILTADLFIALAAYIMYMYIYIVTALNTYTHDTVLGRI